MTKQAKPAPLAHLRIPQPPEHKGARLMRVRLSWEDKGYVAEYKDDWNGPWLRAPVKPFKHENLAHAYLQSGALSP